MISSLRMEYEKAGQKRRSMLRSGKWVKGCGFPTGLALVDQFEYSNGQNFSGGLLEHGGSYGSTIRSAGKESCDSGCRAATPG
jgi:hypothetical protein